MKKLTKLSPKEVRTMSEPDFRVLLVQQLSNVETAINNHVDTLTKRVVELEKWNNTIKASAITVTVAVVILVIQKIAEVLVR